MRCSGVAHVLVLMQGGALTGSLCGAAVVFGARAAGPAAASGSSSDRAAFVSRGCWSPCDQSCHSLFGQRAQAAGVTGGEGQGLTGSGREAVEVVCPPPLHTDKWHQ